MTSEQSSVAWRGLALWAITAVAVISISFGLGWPRALAASRDDQRQAAPAVPANRSETKLTNVPLSFEPNQGQLASAVQFLSRGSGYAVFLTPGEVVLNLERHQPASGAAKGQTSGAASVDTLRMSLIGASPKAGAVGLAPQPGVVSYFIGNDPKNWRSGIPTYGKVEYPQVYPGVDLIFYGNQRQLEYDFAVAPGADPGRIAWRIEGARASVDRKGNLMLGAPNGSATFEKPLLYQMEGDRQTRVEGSFVVTGNQVRFRLGRYDHSRELIIDPTLSYATYLAGTGADYIGNSTGPGISQAGSSQGLAVDSAGSVYVTGNTYSTDFPTKNGYQNTRASKAGSWPSAYVTKLSADGSALVYSTYLGGNGSDYAYAIAVDASGEAYVAGMTNSVNFPTTSGAYETVCSPTPTNSAPPYAASCNSSNTAAFVSKLNAAGTNLVYSTFLGGYGWAYATGIAVDANGQAYVVGNEEEYCSKSYTFQGCFPTTGGAPIGGSTTGGGSPQYAFVAAFDRTGANLLYSTLFGDFNGFTCANGCGGTYGTGVTVDSSGYFYLIGNTQAGGLPTTTGAFQPTSGPLGSNGGSTGTYVQSWRGYIAKFKPVTSTGGASLAWATYLGGHTGNTGDYLSGITVDSASYVYVAGYTNSIDFPVTSGTYGTVCGLGGTCAAAHVTKLNPSGTSIVWSTYVGGSRQDGGDDLFFTGPIQLDGKGNIYIMGQTGSGFPLVNPVEPAVNGGSMEVVVAELDPTGSNLLFSTRIGSGGLETSEPSGLAVDSAGDIYVAGNTIGPGLITTPSAFQPTASNSGCCYHGFVAKITPGGPAFTAATVQNAATNQAGGIAPNEYISIYGSGLGPATGVSSGITTLLAGAGVSIGGTAAFLNYAADGQINALVPFEVAGAQNTTIQVEYNGLTRSVTVPVVSASPGIFTQFYGPGQAWVVNQDSTFNSASNPAPRNTYVAFWVTGQGAVNAPPPDGVQPTGPPYPAPMLPVSVSLGGTQLPAANVVFDGLIYTGEIQVNVLIPANAPTGSAVPLVVTIGGASSRSDATIAIE